jgi:hypothetical protein
MPATNVHQSVFGFSRNGNPTGNLLHDGYTLIRPCRGSFELQLNAAEEWLCFFPAPMATTRAVSHLVLRG